MGKVLNVDLSSGKIWGEKIPEQVYQQVLSGAGLGAWLLFQRIPKGADPLGEDNILGFFSGLLTGTGALMFGRWMVMGKSPLTGGWGEANCGGNFSPAIKRCGYDGILIYGRSEEPVYLKVIDGKAELVDARHLWGKDTIETEQILKKEIPVKNLRVACIGPAGENLSLISGIVNDRGRIAARSGLGAVMGAKKLKAIALAGKEKIPVDNPEQVKKLNQEFLRWLRQGERITKNFPARLLNFFARWLRILPVGFATPGEFIKYALGSYGTVVSNVFSAEIGDSPVKNWKGAGYKDFPMESHSSKLSPERIIAHQKRRYFCYSCPLGCGGIMDLEGKTRFDLKEMHKPEYETCSAFGSLILNNDLEAIYFLNDLLNRAGMDTISCGAVVAFAMECYEQGILKKEELDGLELSWGNSEAVIELVKKMIHREGIGELFADGVKRASEKLNQNSERFAMHAGGQELPMHDCRFDPGWAVAYSMEPTPARHSNYSYLFIELFGLHKIFKGIPKPEQVFTRKGRLDPKGKEVLLSTASKYVQLCNGAGGCLFGLQLGGRLPIIQYLNAGTGWNKSPQEYLIIGERIQQIRQAFNIKQGKIPKRDFKLPDRAVGKPGMEYGPLKGIEVPIEELTKNFARAMGWDEQGKPLRERLLELGLEEIARELYPD